MSDPDRRALELRWLKNERELCRLDETRRHADDFFAPAIARLETEQTQIEAELAKYLADPATDPLGWIRQRHEYQDDLLEVIRIHGVIHVHPTDGSVSTHRRTPFRPAPRLRRRRNGPP